MLLLDEPAAGVPRRKVISSRVVASLDPEIAILIIEHDMDLVFRFARRITVLVQGRSSRKARRREIAADEWCATSISARKASATCLSRQRTSMAFAPAMAIPSSSRMCVSRSRGREIARGHRPQWRRQDDPARHDHGTHQPSRVKIAVERQRYFPMASHRRRVCRARLRAAGTPNLPFAHRGGESGSRSAAGHVEPRARYSTCFPGLRSESITAATSFPAASSRCWRSAAPSIGNPSLLLMDEPLEGLAPIIVEELARAVKRLAQADGLSLILVEQNARLALDISPRAVVMDRGHVVYDGASEVTAARSRKARAAHWCSEKVSAPCDLTQRATHPTAASSAYPPWAFAAQLLTHVDLRLGRKSTLGVAFIAVSATKPIE